MKNSRKTVHTIEATGKKEKIGKKKIKELKDSYVVIGNKKFSAPLIVKKNPVALKKWMDIMELYATCDHVDVVTSADIGLLERYSLMYSEYQLFLEAKQEIRDLAKKSALEAMKLSVELRLDNKINATAKLLLQMETELFLTPLSKSRAIPRKKAPKEDGKLTEKGFNLK